MPRQALIPTNLRSLALQLSIFHHHQGTRVICNRVGPNGLAIPARGGRVTFPHSTITRFPARLPVCSAIGLRLACVAVCVVSACSKVDTPAALPAAALPIVTAPAADARLATTLCGVLRKKAPELKGMPEVAARAQLVMAIAAAFDVNAAALATVSSEIDAVSVASCPEVREPLLAATRASSLQEAVR